MTSQFRDLTKVLQTNVLLLFTVIIAACVVQSPLPDSAHASIDDVFITSRGIDIPITFVNPVPRSDQPVPLVVLVHGHGGTRDEAGAFTRVAAGLARLGIASVRPDFPGCGDSKEPFTKNNLHNMLQDVGAAIEFATAHPNIDAGRVGILGYSMGARLSMLTVDDSATIDVAVLWAAVGTNGADAMFAFFGGNEQYLALRDRAKRSGSALFTTPWGQDQQLGYRWFTDMEASRPLDAIAAFRGPLLLLHGTGDRVIDPAVSLAVKNAATRSSELTLDLVEGASHGFGFFSESPDVSDYVVDTTVDFFATHLLEMRPADSPKTP